MPVHVGSEFAFLLVGHAGWMPMRPVGLADQGWAGPVVAAKPGVDVGPGVVVLAAWPAYAIFLCRFHRKLAVLHIIRFMRLE